MHTDDIPAGLHLCRLSGWNQLEADWRAFLDSPDGGGRLVERGGTAVGTVTFLRYGSCFSWLSMMLVHPDARRTGVGTRLMEAALDALAAEPCVRLDATPLGEPLYRRFGFDGEYELVRTTVAVRPGLVPANAGVRRTEPSDLSGVFARDREVFGADRSGLLAGFYRRAPELAYILQSGGAPAGYCFGRPGYRYRQLGPVVAEDQDAARRIVIGCLADKPDGTVAMDVPLDPAGWSAWLESAGFTMERPFLRMHRGTNPGSGIRSRQFAIAGPEFG